MTTSGVRVAGLCVPAMTGCWPPCAEARWEWFCLWRPPGWPATDANGIPCSDYCGLVGCLLADESSVYDPRLPNDRLLLGMKGTMSEMELSTLRHRSEEALRRKAGRGELFMTVAVGYVRVDRDRIGMDPDQRVREAVALVFRKFAELGSIRQVHLWLRHEGIELPALVPGGSAQRIEWKLPVYNSIHHMLTNPVYAGAYAFGRTGTRTYLENGHKRVVHGIRRRREEWEVLIRDHHDGYITWAEYERNQKVIADNANCQGAAARGSIRQGEALLAGLVRCGHCGRNLHVTYPGDQRSMARYACRGGHVNHGTELCISFGGLRVDRAVGEAVLHVLRPLGIEAALKAIEERRRASCEVLRQAELALEAARFEEQHARRQYDAVDPDNRLVASELERRWNERLEVVRQREEAVSALLASREQEVLGPDERDEYLVGRPQSSWTRIKGESDVTRRWGYGSVEAGEGSWVGADGGSPEGDRSRRRRGGDGVGGLGAGTTVEREPETGCGVAAAA